MLFILQITFFLKGGSINFQTNQMWGIFSLLLSVRNYPEIQWLKLTTTLLYLMILWIRNLGRDHLSDSSALPLTD